MPETVTSPMFAADQSFCDLVIDTFDQWHNPTDAVLGSSTLPTFCRAIPADMADAA
jgi:hypothetical protein